MFDDPGDILLLDEISLAEDAVLERLNSVLEPGRSLTLAERGGASGSRDGDGHTIVVTCSMWLCILHLPS